MENILLLIILLIWFSGTLIRIYKQARYYQIEEYMSNRYLRWLLQERPRWLPSRLLGAVLIGIAVSVILGEAPDSLLPHFILIAFSILACWPPSEGEIKRKFVRTQRVTRMLGSAFLLSVILMLVTISIAGNINLPDMNAMKPAKHVATGLVVFLLAPFMLMGGNLIMTPVEAMMRRRFMNRAVSVIEAIQPRIIGITGSYGKTTTKNFMRDILNGRYRTYATPKSYNTLMGICLAINNDVADDYSIEYFISEMGAYVPGEIERICSLTPPDIAVVTEVGPQHLERFGTLENVAIAKYEIIKGLPPDGTGVFNWDNTHVREMFERGYPATRIAVSKTLSRDEARNNGVRFISTDIHETLHGLNFEVHDLTTGEQVTISTPVIGEHNVTNLLLTIAVAVHEGMPLKDVAFRARMLQPAESRLVKQVTATGITIINDAYSANPVGVVSALKVLGMHTTGKRLLITPGMVELGELHEAENYKLGQLSTQYASDIILVGRKQTEPIKKGILTTGFPADRLQTVDVLSEAVQWYEQNLQAGDTVLFLNDLPDTY